MSGLASLLLSASPLAAIASVIWMMVRITPALKQMKINRELGLVGTLSERISQLEARIANLERLLASEQSKHAGEVSVLRHKLGNEAQTTEAVLMWARGAPDKLQQMLPLIEAARQERARQIALEQTAMLAGGWHANPVEEAAKATVQAAKDTLSEVQAHVGESKP